MVKCNKCLLYKKIKEFNKDNRSKRGVQNVCKNCEKLYRIANKERLAKRAKEYILKNPRTEYINLWVQKNRSKRNAISRKYSKNNRDKTSYLCAKARASKKQRTPKWLNEEHKRIIKDLYRKAHILSKQLGIRHEVDHIVPIQSEYVSGLHVPWNLRIVTRSENASKGNKIISELIV